MIFVGVGVLLLVRKFLDSICGPFDTNYTPQAAKDIRKSHETLIEIFGRIESFFRRLVIYTQVPSTKEMLDTITQVMVEVITILGIAMKEINQGRISE